MYSLQLAQRKAAFPTPFNSSTYVRLFGGTASTAKELEVSCPWLDGITRRLSTGSSKQFILAFTTV